MKSRAIIVLSFGLLAVSVSSVFIKLCDAPSMVIAFYRLSIAALFYWIVARVKGGSVLKAFSPFQLRWTVISGLFLGFHFITWIASLKYTSVASSVFLVQTAPIFVALGGYYFLNEPFNRLKIAGIFIAITGSVFISIFEINFKSGSMWGNLLAVGGAAGVSGYLLIGNRIRRHMDIFRYVAIVYTTAALFTLLFVFGARVPLFAYRPFTFLFLLAIAVFPQIIGHTSFNWALKYFSATSVAFIILGEPVLASIQAWVFLKEVMSPGKIIGAVLLLCGVILVLYAENTQKSIKSDLNNAS
ncbi:DMT family transporter [candidate division KSB1 bacterium]|nr:DMT family transporter [candidate division KSB1 bacterium]